MHARTRISVVVCMLDHYFYEGNVEYLETVHTGLGELDVSDEIGRLIDDILEEALL